MKKLIILLLLLLATAYPLHPAFKDWGWGTRPAGMGSVFTAISDDVNAPLWNPAGLSQLGRKEATFMYAKPYLGLGNVDFGLMYFGYAHPLPSSFPATVGLNISDFNAAELYKENVISLSCAGKIIESKVWCLSTGISVKYLSHGYNWEEGSGGSFGNFREVAIYYGDPVVSNGNSVGALTLDLGILAKFSKISVGLTGKNITEPNVGLYYKDKVPSELSLGFGYRVASWKGMSDIILGADLLYRNQEWGNYSDKSDMSFGAEGWLEEHTYGLRAGKNNHEISLGGSLRKELVKDVTLQIDYAMIWSSRIADNLGTHRISISLKFGAPLVQPRP